MDEPRQSYSVWQALLMLQSARLYVSSDSFAWIVLLHAEERVIVSAISEKFDETEDMSRLFARAHVTHALSDWIKGLVFACVRRR